MSKSKPIILTIVHKLDFNEVQQYNNKITADDNRNENVNKNKIRRNTLEFFAYSKTACIYSS